MFLPLLRTRLTASIQLLVRVWGGDFNVSLRQGFSLSLEYRRRLPQLHIKLDANWIDFLTSLKLRVCQRMCSLLYPFTILRIWFFARAQRPSSFMNIGTPDWDSITKQMFRPNTGLESKRSLGDSPINGKISL